MNQGIGVAALEITDESLIPDELCTVTVTMLVSQWRDVRPVVVPETWSPPLRIGSRTVDTAAVRARLQEKCPACVGIGAGWNNSAAIPCKECDGTGRRLVPGARLGERGESVIVSR